MQDHLLSLSPGECEAGVKGLLDRRCVCRAVGYGFVEIDDLSLCKGLITHLQVGRCPGI